MADYIYAREATVGGVNYNVENPERVDGSSNQIRLAQEVETALPGKTFKLRCNGTEVKFIFDIALSAGEETTLTNTVTAHKNNT